MAIICKSQICVQNTAADRLKFEPNVDFLSCRRRKIVPLKYSRKTQITQLNMIIFNNNLFVGTTCKISEIHEINNELKRFSPPVNLVDASEFVILW